MDILNIDPRVLLIQIFGFVLLMLILKKFFFGPVGQMLASRREEIADTYQEAEQARATMENLRRDYEKRLTEVETEAHERIQAAVKEAQNVRDEILNDARAKADDILQRGEMELDRERKKAIVELREEVANLVISASSSILEKSLDDAAHRKLVEDFISSVGKTK